MTSIEQQGIDEYYMRMVLSLAMQGTGMTSPNPRVGCVIVKDGTILSSGWHHRFGDVHAEVDAVQKAACDIRGATVYVNLEPCCHYGKTPPCSDMLVKQGISRVVIGITDPNPVVDCRGVDRLENAGIVVNTGVLEDDCRWINRGFIRSMKNGRPWVTLKTASSLDGNISLADGSSKWITGAQSREKVHLMRAENDAVITGVGTIIADDPKLTVRETSGRTPLRVVMDNNLSTPINAKIFDGGIVLFFTDKNAPKEKIRQFQTLGAEIEIIDTSPEKQIEFILRKLCEKGVNYLMVEAGAGVTSSFLSSGFVDEISLFIAPKLLGHGLHYTEHLDISRMEDSIDLKNVEYSACGNDLWVKGVLKCSPDL